MEAPATPPSEDRARALGHFDPAFLARLAGSDRPADPPDAEAAARARLLDGPLAEVLRAVPGRETGRLELDGEPGPVVKRHGGEPWADRLRARLRGQGGVPPGRREHEALERLAAAGLRVPRALGWAADGPRSAVALEHVPHAETLRDRAARAGPEELARWARRVGELAARLHGAGWYHRDLYLQHLLLPDADVDAGEPEPEPVLIDVGRARHEPGARRRWWVKDLGALLHSTPPEVPFGLRLRALARYLDLRGVHDRAERRAWARAVEVRRARIAAHVPRHGEAAPGAGPVRPAHLVVRAPNWVGDLVMATPVLEAAARSARWPRVTVLVPRHLLPVLEDGPWCVPGVRLRPFRGGEQEAAHLAALAPDAVLLLNHSLGSARRARSARVPEVLGAALGGRGPLLTRSVVPPTHGGRRLPVPTAHVQRDVAGLADLVLPDLEPVLAVRAEVADRVRDRLVALGLAPGQGYVVCCPGAAKGAAKLWPAERFAAALDRLCRVHGLRGVVTGGPGEGELVRAVVEASAEPALDLAREGLGLDGLKALVRDARLVLVGDSGPRWYAAAFRVPCVSVMGPNFPELTATSLERCTVVRLDGLECAPCLERTCPLGHHRCMTDLPVAAVVRAAERLLERFPAGDAARPRPSAAPAPALPGRAAGAVPDGVPDARGPEVRG